VILIRDLDKGFPTKKIYNRCGEQGAGGREQGEKSKYSLSEIG
jgi:hypothetical protein